MGDRSKREAERVELARKFEEAKNAPPKQTSAPTFRSATICAAAKNSTGGSLPFVNDSPLPFA
jgi:hypothetical protein